MDLNSLTSQYLEKNKDAKFDDIKSAVDNLTISYRESFDLEERDGSIFSKYEDSDGLTQDEFVTLMSEATGKSKSEIEKDAILLYQVLNSDEDMSSLTNEELAVLMDDGEITSYTVWSGLSLDEETVNEKVKASSDDAKVDGDKKAEEDPKVEEGADVEAAKTAIKENVNPRKWVCVGVEDEKNVIVDNRGDLIVLIMENNHAQTIHNNFKNLK